jgi:GH24 family phage-related lysozyme (muramidase)
MPTKEEEILRILSNSSIDFDFIKDREGYSLEGYVPEPDKSQSGVTIASGFDLGQKQKSDLQGLPKTLQDKLTKYLGKKKQQAVEELQKFPLIITDEEAKLLNKKAKEDSVHDLTTKWKNKTGKNFSELTPSQQTAIASVYFQYGDLESAPPNFWNSVTNNQWGDAISELRNFKDAYPTRRNLEADLLEQSTYETNQAQRPLTSIPGINEDLKPLPMPIIDIEFAN